MVPKMFPSFDLGIDSDLNTHCGLMDGGIIHHVKDDMTINHSSEKNGSTSYQDVVFVEDNSKSKKQKTNSNTEDIAGKIMNESNYSQGVYALDDDLVFTEEYFKIMDESAEKNQIAVNNSGCRVPIDFEEDIPQEMPLKRIHKPSACLKSPYIRSFDSASNDAQEDPDIIFQYRLHGPT
ncbi:Uncharacterized protein Adt_41811 [Abeliophyllum distichum]|uniref:Uncharacterized protein n=1 Tax=Abeliophyllum distichum TaxID=126358 RepID=A0ABD1PPV9_9LAMI